MFSSTIVSRGNQYLLHLFSLSYHFSFEGIVLSGLIQHIHPTYGKLTDPFYYLVWDIRSIYFLIFFSSISVSRLEPLDRLDICFIFSYIYPRCGNLSIANRARQFSNGMCIHLSENQWSIRLLQRFRLAITPWKERETKHVDPTNKNVTETHHFLNETD